MQAQAQVAKNTGMLPSGKKTYSKVTPSKGNALKKVKATAKTFNDPGEKGAFRWIDKRLLNVDHSYQRRRIRTKIVGKIVNKLAWTKFQVISAMQREDGTLWVTEGQHRLKAILLRDDIQKVPCMVFQSKGVEEESDAFKDINVNRSNPNPYERYNADLAQQDSVARLANTALEWMGAVLVTPGTITNPYGKRSFSAIGKLQELAKQSQNDVTILKGVCEQVKDITTDDEYISDTLLRGLYFVATQTNGESLTPYWNKRFKDIGSKELVQAALNQTAAMGLNRGSGGVWALGIAGRANYRLNPNNRLHFTVAV